MADPITTAIISATALAGAGAGAAEGTAAQEDVRRSRKKMEEAEDEQREKLGKRNRALAEEQASRQGRSRQIRTGPLGQIGQAPPLGRATLLGGA